MVKNKHQGHGTVRLQNFSLIVVTQWCMQIYAYLLKLMKENYLPYWQKLREGEFVSLVQDERTWLA